MRELWVLLDCHKDLLGEAPGDTNGDAEEGDDDRSSFGDDAKFSLLPSTKRV